MIHRPKTVSGYVVLSLLVVSIATIVALIVASQQSLIVAAIIGVLALACLALILWRRRVEADKERAWVGSFSFGDVVAARRAREAAETA